MTDNDDAAAMAYLKSVTSIKRRCFRKGFVGINEAASLPQNCNNNTNEPCILDNDNVCNELKERQKNEYNSECRFRLPKRKRKRRTEEILISEESGAHDKNLSSVKSVQVMDKTLNVAGQNKSSVITETSKIDNSEETPEIMTSTPSETEPTTARTTQSLQKTRNKIPLLSKVLALTSIIDYRSKPLSIACSPPVLFVESTVSRLTLARERFVFLRGAVEDSTLSLNQLKAILETEYANHQSNRKKEIHHAIPFEKINSRTEKVDNSSDDENYNYNTRDFAISNEHVVDSSIQVRDVAIVVNKSTLNHIKELLSNNFGPTECCCWSLQETRQLLTEMLTKRKLFSIPASINVSELHNYIELHGPTTNELPSLSKLIWLSSANTTLFFTVLIQRFLRSFRLKCKEYAAEVDHRPECCSLPNIENANEAKHWMTNIKDNNKNNNNRSCTENSTTKENGEAQNIEDGKLTKQQKYILLFFEHLMPTLCDEVNYSSQTNRCNQCVVYGYGVWLLALCVALDTPLDPDTDRIVHELFVIMCRVIRALGDEKHILGSERGALLQSFEHASPSQEFKKYTTMNDVGKEEVMALYTFVIIFAKFFRQNQDHVIEL